MVYKGTFTKKNGDLREMKFKKLSEMTEAELFILFGDKEGKETKKRNLQEGMEVVYDVDAKGLRIFNFSTLVGEITTING